MDPASVRPSASVFRSHFQTSSPLKPLGQPKPNFMWSLLGKGDEVCINGPGHMTKMAAMPIYGKNLKKSSSPELAGRFPRIWYVALGTPAHHSLYKLLPWSDLDLFYGKVKFGNLGFSIGKSENSGFFGKY